MPELHIPASAGSRQRAYLAVPPVGDGPHPGVIVLQDALGATSDLHHHTERPAAAGFLALAPRLDTARGGGPRCVAGVMRSMTTGTGPVFDDIEAARGWLAARPDCTGTIGIIGFCQGGGFALLSAARHDYAAAAPNYGILPADPDRDLVDVDDVPVTMSTVSGCSPGCPSRIRTATGDCRVQVSVSVTATQYEDRRTEFRGSVTGRI